MKKIYLDQQIWQYLYENEPIQELKNKISRNALELHISTGNIYEFGRLILNKNNETFLKNIFAYLWEITKYLKFVKEVDSLIKDDFVYAKTGGKILPYLDIMNVASAKQEIFKLSKNNCLEGKGFIADREREIVRHSPEYIKRVKQSNHKAKKEPFESLRDDWVRRRYILQESKYNKESKFLSNSLLFTQPQKYPFLNTYINSELYIFYAVLFENAKPENYTSDFRHIICANAADCFITNDTKLINLAPKIYPYIRVFSWDYFYNNCLNN